MKLINTNLVTSISTNQLFKEKNKFINKLIDNVYYKSNDIKHTNINNFKKYLYNSYNNKSLTNFIYYINNCTKSYNLLTNTLKMPLDKNGEYLYSDNIDLRIDGTYKVKEHKQGQFLDKQFKKQGLKNFTKVKHLQHINKHKKQLFLTLTLPGKYHFYKQQNNKLIHNPKCDFNNIEDSLNSGYDYLNKAYRQFYKNTKRNLSKAKLKKNFDYILVIEPHKSLQLHIHALFFVENEQIDIFYKTYKQIKKTFKLKQTKLDLINTKKYLKDKKQKTQVSSYLYKYLIKEYKANETNEYARIKSFFKYKTFFRTTNYKHNITQQQIDFVYKYLYKYDTNTLNEMKQKETPLFTQIIELINNKTFIFEYEKVKGVKIDFKKLYEFLEVKINNINTQYKKLNNVNLQQQHKQELTDLINKTLFNNIDLVLKNVKVKRLTKVIYTKNNIKSEIFNINDLLNFTLIKQNFLQMFANVLDLNYCNNVDIVQYFKELKKLL